MRPRLAYTHFSSAVRGSSGCYIHEVDASYEKDQQGDSCKEIDKIDISAPSKFQSEMGMEMDTSQGLEEILENGIGVFGVWIIFVFILLISIYPLFDGGFGST